MRLERAIEKFLYGYFATRDLSEKTYKAYAGDLRQLLAYFGQKARLRALRSGDIELFIRHLRTSGYATTSIRRKIATLKLFFSYWLRKKKIALTPFRELQIKIPPSTSNKVKNISAADIDKLYAQAHANYNGAPLLRYGKIDRKYLALRDWALLDLLFTTGLRVSEALSLQHFEIMEGDPYLRVIGKGNRPRIAFIAAPASLNLQGEHLQHRKGLRDVATTKLFLNYRGEGLSPHGVTYLLKRLAAQGSLECDISPHRLRHSVATLLLANGEDIRIVQTFLGHASIRTTQRYTHLNKDQVLTRLAETHPSAKMPSFALDNRRLCRPLS